MYWKVIKSTSAPTGDAVMARIAFWTSKNAHDQGNNPFWIEDHIIGGVPHPDDIKLGPFLTPQGYYLDDEGNRFNRWQLVDGEWIEVAPEIKDKKAKQKKRTEEMLQHAINNVVARVSRERPRSKTGSDVHSADQIELGVPKGGLKGIQAQNMHIAFLAQLKGGH